MKISEMGLDPKVVDEIKRLCAHDAKVARDRLKAEQKHPSKRKKPSVNPSAPSRKTAEKQ